MTRSTHRQRGDVDHTAHRTPRRWSRVAAARPSAPLLLARDDRHPPSIRPAQNVDGGASHRCASTFDERSDRHGRGSVDRRHLGGGDDRDTGQRRHDRLRKRVGMGGTDLEPSGALAPCEHSRSPCSTSSG